MTDDVNLSSGPLLFQILIAEGIKLVLKVSVLALIFMKLVAFLEFGRTEPTVSGINDCR